MITVEMILITNLPWVGNFSNMVFLSCVIYVCVWVFSLVDCFSHVFLIVVVFHILPGHINLRGCVVFHYPTGTWSPWGHLNYDLRVYNYTTTTNECRRFTNYLRATWFHICVGLSVYAPIISPPCPGLGMSPLVTIPSWVWLTFSSSHMVYTPCNHSFSWTTWPMVILTSESCSTRNSRLMTYILCPSSLYFSSCKLLVWTWPHLYDFPISRLFPSFGIN